MNLLKHHQRAEAMAGKDRAGNHKQTLLPAPACALEVA
jgi:hypothetical protein